MAILHASLAPAVRNPQTCIGAGALLDPAGPDTVLGEQRSIDNLALPVVPSAGTLFGPRGVYLDSNDGTANDFPLNKLAHRLWVTDTGHHRLLGWSMPPAKDGAECTRLIGQPSFAHEGRNAKIDPCAATLNVPTAVCVCGQALVVADAWNHRVLVWLRRPERDNQPADIVLGQLTFSETLANRGVDTPDADTLFWPYGVAWDGQSLWVADTGNRRVLMWYGLPNRNGQPADLVLGQKDFCRRDENGGSDPSAMSMRWPHAIAFWSGRLCVADAGNNRIMLWEQRSLRNGENCDHVLGQRNLLSVEHNQGRYWPCAASLNMPYGVAASGEWLIVADTANSRLLAWHCDDIATGASARLLAGQPTFDSKGDNRWALPARDSLCWPYAVHASGGMVAIADSGNNRVHLWRIADGLQP